MGCSKPPVHSQPYLTPFDSESKWVRGDINTGTTRTLVMLGLLRPSRKFGDEEGSWILRTRRYQKEAVPKVLSMDLSGSMRCQTYFHNNTLFLVLTFARMRQDDGGQTAGILVQIKTVGSDYSGGQCFLYCHVLTMKIIPVSHKNVPFLKKVNIIIILVIFH